MQGSIDDETACRDLVQIACNDDDETCDPFGSGDLHPGRSTLCVEDLIPGDLYYVMVGAKTDEPDPDDPELFHALGVYRLDIESPCTPPGPVNDRCNRAAAVAEGVTPFDLVGAVPDCPVPPSWCTRSLGNDIWYEWTAPCIGQATIETCGEDETSTPDTGLIVYRGCDCPPLDDQIVGCSEFVPPPCSGGSKVTIDVEAGECYKLRVGGDDGGTPSGDLTITTACTCASGPVTFVDPPDGVVDARQPHPSNSPFPSQGIRSITVQAPDGAGDPSCWSLCETSGGAPPGIVSVDNGNGTYVLQLARPLTPGEVTTLTYANYQGGKETTGTFYVHPGNVDGGPTASPGDVTAFVDCCLNRQCEPLMDAQKIYRCDIDRNGRIAPVDLLREIDLLSGAEFYSPWLGTTRPATDGICP